jgi:hypothetical protein
VQGADIGAHPFERDMDLGQIAACNLSQGFGNHCFNGS